MPISTAAVADSDEAVAPPLRRLLPLLLLLWLCGASLRVTLFAVPPLLPAIVLDFGLTATGVGLLSTLPLLMFAVAALPSSALIHRFGAIRVLVAGLLTTLVAASLRSWAGGDAGLYAASLAMGAGIAIMQPALPVVVKLWLPRRVALGTAIYANGLVIWEIIPVWLTPFLVAAVANHDWRWPMLVWSIPVALTLCLMPLVRPVGAAPVQPSPPLPAGPQAAGSQSTQPGAGSRCGAASISADRVYRRLTWREPGFWLIGVLFAGICCAFFITNAFLPLYLLRTGRPEIIGSALTCLNLGQLPATLFLLFFAGRYAARGTPLVVSILLTVISLAVMAFGPPAAFLPACLVLGSGCASGLILGLALPPILALPADVRRVAAGMFAMGYGATFVVAIGGGKLFDLLGAPIWLFVPLFAVGLLQWLSVVGLRRVGYLR